MLLVKCDHILPLLLLCPCMAFISCQGGWYGDPSASSDMWVVLSFTVWQEKRVVGPGHIGSLCLPLVIS